MIKIGHYLAEFRILRISCPDLRLMKWIEYIAKILSSRIYYFFQYSIKKKLFKKEIWQLLSFFGQNAEVLNLASVIYPSKIFETENDDGIFRKLIF